MTQEEAIEIVGERLRSKGLLIHQYDVIWVVGDTSSVTVKAYVAVPFGFSAFSQNRENWASDMGNIFTRVMSKDFYLSQFPGWVD